MFYARKVETRWYNIWFEYIYGCSLCLHSNNMDVYLIFWSYSYINTLTFRLSRFSSKIWIDIKKKRSVRLSCTVHIFNSFIGRNASICLGNVYTLAYLGPTKSNARKSTRSGKFFKCLLWSGVPKYDHRNNSSSSKQSTFCMEAW